MGRSSVSIVVPRGAANASRDVFDARMVPGELGTSRDISFRNHMAAIAPGIAGASADSRFAIDQRVGDCDTGPISQRMPRWQAEASDRLPAHHTAAGAALWPVRRRSHFVARTLAFTPGGA